MPMKQIPCGDDNKKGKDKGKSDWLVFHEVDLVDVEGLADSEERDDDG